MKKIVISILTSILIITGMVMPVFADGKYVPSIEVRDDISLVSDKDIVVGDSDILELIVTPYVRKYDIWSDNSERLIDVAYDIVLATENIADLNPKDITALADSLGIKTEDLIVRDLFDVTLYHNHVEVIFEDGKTYKFRFTIQTQGLDNYVCLLKYHGGVWKVVEDVEVLYEEGQLIVTTDELSPYALVVAKDYKYDPEAATKTCGCIIHILIIIVAIITLLLSLIIRIKDDMDDDKKKKKKRIRDLITILSLILCVILYIFGTCKYDIYALIIEIIVVLLALRYTHKKHEKEENEE